MSGIEGLTALLVAHRGGEAGASSQLVERLYPELRRIARRQLGRWRPGGTLGTGTLVHEAYLKLIDQTQVDWQDRTHFFAITAHAMRQVLVDYARRRKAEKRASGRDRAGIDAREIAIQQQADRLLAVDDLLARLGEVEPRLLQVVECRFFAGFSEAETAEALRISSGAVEQDWLRARAWLRQAIRTMRKVDHAEEPADGRARHSREET